MASSFGHAAQQRKSKGMLHEPSVLLLQLRGTEKDLDSVYEMLSSAPAYSLAISGKLPSRGDAASVFSACPSDLPRERKYVYGIHAGEELVGTADVLHGYPAADIAYIGLLLIRQSFHGRGLGRSSVECIKSLAREWGCSRIRLAVVEDNFSVVGFWVKCGCSDTGRRSFYECGTARSQSMIFEMVL